MSRVSKIWVAAAAVVLIAGGVNFTMLALPSLRESLAKRDEENFKYRFENAKDPRERAQLMQEAHQRAMQRSLERTGSPVYMGEPGQMQVVKRIEGFSFSPDGRFIVGRVSRTNNADLIVWSSQGGPPLVRHSAESWNVTSYGWLNKTQLRIMDEVYNLHKNKNKWMLTKANRVRVPSSNIDSDKRRDYPRQDIRLEVERDNAYTEHQPPRERLLAYALSSGERLPLPAGLESHTQLEKIQPLNRWGKTPLRLVSWQDEDWTKRKTLAENSRLEVWDARAKKRLWAKDMKIEGGRVVVGDAGRVVVAIGTPRKSTVPKEMPGTIHYYNGKRVDKLPDEPLPADGIDVYDALTGKLLAQKTERKMVRSKVRVSPDGKMLVVPIHRFVAGRNQTELVVHTLRNLQMVKKIVVSGEHEPNIVFSRDGRYLVVEIEESLHIYSWQRTDAKGKTPFQQATL